MKRRNQPATTSAEAGEVKPRTTQSWYFARLGLLALPWALRHDPKAKGTLFRQYHLIQAADMSSAFAKAEHILSVSECRTGDASLHGHRVDYRKVGVLDLEPLYQKLESGVELFDECEINVPLVATVRRVIKSEKRRKLVESERKRGTPPLLDVFYGDDFYRL